MNKLNIKLWGSRISTSPSWIENKLRCVTHIGNLGDIDINTTDFQGKKFQHTKITINFQDKAIFEGTLEELRNKLT